MLFRSNLIYLNVSTVTDEQFAIGQVVPQGISNSVLRPAYIYQNINTNIHDYDGEVTEGPVETSYEVHAEHMYYILLDDPEQIHYMLPDYIPLE